MKCTNCGCQRSKKTINDSSHNQDQSLQNRNLVGELRYPDFYVTSIDVISIYLCDKICGQLYPIGLFASLPQCCLDKPCYNSKETNHKYYIKNKNITATKEKCSYHEKRHCIMEPSLLNYLWSCNSH